MENKKEDLPTLQYAIEDVPPWYLWILLGFQHYLTMVGATISIPLILAPDLCIQVGQQTDEVAKAELLSTIFFVSGLATWLQTTFGCRLPIVQGGTFSFLPPTFAILGSFGSCPVVLAPGSNISEYRLNNPNSTDLVVINGSEEHGEVWRVRMRALQGAIMASAVFQVVIGFSGIIGLLLKFIGPLVITPTIALVGLSLFVPAANYASSQWGIALLTVALMTIFSQYLVNTKIPTYSKRLRSCSIEKGYPLFRLFPVILAITVSYIVSIILTYTNVFSNDPRLPGYNARTDSRISVLTNAQWFRFPYPGQWGRPTVTVAGVFGMLAGVLASMIESIGDYYAAARLSGAPPPTTSAINRGIGMEGIGCILAGAWGSGNGTTSYSENIGALGITQVGSRRVIQTGACIMLVLSLLNKFCAVFVTIPDPIVGGIYIVMFGMVTAVGLSNLQFVDLNSSRNLFIVGTSLILGLSLPDWASKNKDSINTGSEVFDEICSILLSTSMFIGGTTAFFLDNTIPGTAKERGMDIWLEHSKTDFAEDTRKKFACYDLPWWNDSIYRASWTSYIPICPNFLSHRRKTASMTAGSTEVSLPSSSSNIDNDFEASSQTKL
ncbi:solute carrier family 23 member 2-like [Watersipora subatra]|uniref:solute carrier family 23 member 2-like n=1 Tax=Watersipora subatra TaxID=2589382 RepID=UPI00355C9D5E